MKRFLAEIHGHLLEARVGSFGGELILVDGRPASERPFAGIAPSRPHHVDLADESGRVRAVEVRFEDASGGLQIGLLAVVSVDGVERVRLAPHKPGERAGRCVNCGYALRGLTVTRGEVQCPECGRHTSARLAGLDEQA